MKNRFAITTGLIAGALLISAAPAMARTDVSLNIGVPGVVYAQPAPVYVPPPPVYVQPRPIYVQPTPVYAPAPAYVVGAPYRSEWGYHRHHHHRHHDRDRDGIPNRYDRYPNNPYRY